MNLTRRAFLFGQLSFISLIVQTPTARADELPWRAALSPLKPGRFPAPRDLDADYGFGWSAFRAADAKCSVLSLRGGQMRFELQMSTVGAVRKMWLCDVEFTGLTRAASLRTISAKLAERYDDGSRTTIMTADTAGLTRVRVNKPAEADDGKPKRFKVPEALDMSAALFFIRSQRLQTGEQWSLCVYPASGGYLADVEVLGREEIKVAGQKRPAIKLGLRMRALDKKLAVTAHKKFKRATFWLSDDADRVLLRGEAEVMIGRVWMELEKLNFPTTGAASRK